MRATLVAVFLAIAVGVAASMAVGHPSRPGEKYVSVPWDPDVNDGAPAGRKIQILYRFNGGYACQYRFHRAAARETGDAVTIKVLAHKRDMGQDEVCPAVLGGGKTVVKLKQPLGDRELRHAPTNDSTVIDTFP